MALAGWALAALCLGHAWRMRRRLELVARATHELRAPASALTFAVAVMRRTAGGRRWARALESELERLRTGLADLEAARDGRRAPARPRVLALEAALRAAVDGWRPAAAGAGRPLRVRWDAGRAHVRADPGRIAQALGNLLGNAIEHGSGPIEVRAVRKGPRAVRVEVADRGPAVRGGRRRLPPPDRGHGLRIAARSVREAGGSLGLERGRDGTTAIVELPVAAPDGDGRGASSRAGSPGGAPGPDAREPRRPDAPSTGRP